MARGRSPPRSTSQSIGKAPLLRVAPFALKETLMGDPLLDPLAGRLRTGDLHFDISQPGVFLGDWEMTGRQLDGPFDPDTEVRAGKKSSG